MDPRECVGSASRGWGPPCSNLDLGLFPLTEEQGQALPGPELRAGDIHQPESLLFMELGGCVKSSFSDLHIALMSL